MRSLSEKSFLPRFPLLLTFASRIHPTFTTGGNDKQGFPMRQGVLTNKRVKLLMAAGKHTSPLFSLRLCLYSVFLRPAARTFCAAHTMRLSWCTLSPSDTCFSFPCVLRLFSFSRVFFCSVPMATSGRVKLLRHAVLLVLRHTLQASLVLFGGAGLPAALCGV